MKQTVHIVIGAGYGDEGKGLATDFLAKPDGLVVRFNSGPQAGHTVTRPDGRRHVFSHLGSGTLKGTPTYWSRFCAVGPSGFLRELEVLKKNFPELNPTLYIDPLCPVITPWDMAWNQWTEHCRQSNRHGSCGIGFGTTIARQETPSKLFAVDLFNPVFLEAKLYQINRYYWSLLGNRHLPEGHALRRVLGSGDFHFRKDINRWLGDVERFTKIAVVTSPNIFKRYSHFVFEGAQGILLDQDFGCFPHVTRSNTTSKNALALVNNHIRDPEITIHYMTRTYSTRHGAGPMPNEDHSGWRPTNPYEHETNTTNQWQGELRYGRLDQRMIDYAVSVDTPYVDGLEINRKMFVTCNDQEPEPQDIVWPVPVGARSFGPCREDVKNI